MPPLQDLIWVFWLSHLLSSGFFLLQCLCRDKPNLRLAKEGLGGDSGFWSRHHGSGHGGGDHGGFLSVVTAVVFYRAMEVVRTAW
jgi:hypothetical protein